MEKKNLNEVSIIRPILIVLLVLYHSFAPWCDAWTPIEGFENNELYWWIGKLSYSFMLPMFVFISGYVWSFQRNELNKTESLSCIAKKKFNRLIIPSLLFGVAYILLIDYGRMGGNYVLIIYNLLSGYAHMWFLPMLFWVFIVSWFIVKIKNTYIRYSVVLLILIMNALPLPLGLREATFYEFFFILGYDLFTLKNKLNRLIVREIIILSWISFIVVFVASTLTIKTIEFYSADKSMFVRAIGYECENIIKVIYGILGIMSMLCTSIYISQKYSLPNLLINIGCYCFGVYLSQQFVLQALYYKSQLPIYLSEGTLPWICFIITLIVSLLFSYLLRLTKVGRAII